MDRDNFTISAWFVVNSVRYMIPKDYGVLLKFYNFIHSSKPHSEIQTLVPWGGQINENKIPENVKSMEWKFICKT